MHKYLQKYAGDWKIIAKLTKQDVYCAQESVQGCAQIYVHASAKVCAQVFAQVGKSQEKLQKVAKIAKRWEKWLKLGKVAKSCKSSKK